MKPSPMKPSLAVLLLSVFFVLSCDGQTIPIKKLDSLFTVLDNRGLATGSMAVSLNGKIVYRKAIGFALMDGEYKFAPDSNTKYRIGSVSKIFTAVMVFQLIEEQKLSLHEKLSVHCQIKN